MAKSVLDTDYPVRTWSRTTVADGNWLNTNTIQPLIDRTNVLEEDQADLLNSTNHMVDSLGNDMEVIAGNGIKFTVTTTLPKQFCISVSKSSLIYNTGSAHQAEYVEAEPPYFNLNTNVVTSSVIKTGENIEVENGAIKIKAGIYAISCNITLNTNGLPDETIYPFYLKLNDVMISCPFNNKTGPVNHESMYNLSTIVKVDNDTVIDLRLYCDKDPKTASDDFVINKNTILQYLAISEL